MRINAFRNIQYKHEIAPHTQVVWKSEDRRHALKYLHSGLHEGIHVPSLRENVPGSSHWAVDPCSSCFIEWWFSSQQLPSATVEAMNFWQSANEKPSCWRKWVRTFPETRARTHTHRHLRMHSYICSHNRQIGNWLSLQYKMYKSQGHKKHKFNKTPRITSKSLCCTCFLWPAASKTDWLGISCIWIRTVLCPTRTLTGGGLEAWSSICLLLDETTVHQSSTLSCRSI